MATAITSACPIDGLPLTAVNVDFLKNEQDDRDNHLHISVIQSIQCVNGHRWKLGGDLILERIGG